MIKVFNTLTEFSTYTSGGMISGDLYYVVEDESVHFLTNNIDGNDAVYDMIPSGKVASDISAWQEKWGPYLKQVSETITEYDPTSTSSVLSENSDWTMTNLLNGTAGLSDALAFYYLMMYVYLGYHPLWDDLGIEVSDSDKLFPYSAEEYFVADYNSLDAATGIIVGKRSSNLYDFTSNYTTNYYYVFAYDSSDSDSDGISFEFVGGPSTEVGGVSGIEFTSPYQLDYEAHYTKIGDDLDAETISEGIFQLYEISASDWYNNYIEPYFLNSISGGGSSDEGDSDGGSEGGEDTPTPSADYSSQYLTFEPIADSTFTFTQNALQYSVDNGSTWTTLAKNTASPTVSAGNKIMWKQTNPTINSNYGIGTFSSTGNFNVSGNIMSLLYGDDFENQVDLTGKNFVFYNLFKNSLIVNSENLILPATTLEQYCYGWMFQGCTSLTTAPELPAITLSENCYPGMFQDCTSLTTAPELPATTLTTNCYGNMFNGCTSLNYIKCLATNTSIWNMINDWVNGVAASGTFVKAASMTSFSTGKSGIPSGWTVEDAA